MNNAGMLNSSGGKWMDRCINENRIFNGSGFLVDIELRMQSLSAMKFLSIPLSGYLDMQIRNKKNDKRV